MSQNRLNIAILSPSKNAYSETFIQAHKEHLNGSVKFYYGSRDSQSLDGEGPLLSGLARYAGKALNRLRREPGFAENKALMASWRKHGVQVILAEYGTTAAEYLDVIKASKLALVVHFHGFDASMHDTLSKYKDQYQQVFEYASFIVVVSSVMHEALLSLGCPREKLVIDIYGPNPKFHNIAPSYSSQQFIAIGRFTDKKAPHHTIAAFRHVLDHYPQARLIMAGNGSLLDSCKALVQKYGIGTSVEFPGIITPEQFIGYLEGSCAFVQHSVIAENGDMEGTPLAVLESSAAGLPVVSTFHAGIPDVIRHEETGLLVMEHDVNGMGQYMLKLLQNPELAREMGQKGRNNIACNFSLKNHIDKLDSLLAKAVIARSRVKP